MSLRLRMVYSCLTGAWGGYLAWLLIDWVFHFQADGYRDALINGLLVGLCIGLLMSGFEGGLEGSRRSLIRRAVGGLIVSAIGGVVGLLIGEWLYQLLDGLNIGRITGWAIFGLAIGVGEGILTRSWQRTLLGAVGGLVGGILGSVAFLFLLGSASTFNRTLSFTLLGALIGLLIGFAPVAVSNLFGLLKVVSSGRHEGKELLLMKELSSLGSDDRCDLALYGVGEVQFRHAEVRREAQGYTIRALTEAPLWINGQSIRHDRLRTGDRIRLGKAEVLFRMKGTTAN